MKNGNIQHIECWIEKLHEIISGIKSNHREAIVVAISRKMPRFFNWLSQQPDNTFNIDFGDDTTSVKEFVESLNITTEYALPFLFKEEENRIRYEVVVVDDIIIHGSTLRQVSSDIFAMIGKKPIASTIFKCAYVGTFPYADTSYIDKMTHLTESESKEAQKFISDAILSSSLPMDLVFPSFHVSEELARNFATSLQGIFSCYAINREDKFISSISFILDDKSDFDYSNDYTKCRVFFKGSEAIITVYVSNVIEEDLLLDSNPFVNEKYRAIWSDIQKATVNVSSSHVRSNMQSIEASFAAESRIKERISISLGTMANYLFAISAMNRLIVNTGGGITDNDPFKVELDDLKLLIGENLATGLIGKINDLLKLRAISPSRRDKVFIDNVLCPSECRNRYDELKSYISHRAGSIDGILHEIFKIHRNPERLGLLLSPSMSPETAGIGETFESLKNALFHIEHSASVKKKAVHEYIDRQIDEGQVSSFYSRVTSPGGVTYIKRFFRAGSNSFL